MAPKAHSDWIRLHKPIEREGAAALDAIRLRRPKASDLSGTSLRDVLEMDVRTTLIVAPRLIEPFVVSAEVAELDPRDLLAIAKTLVLFLIAPAEAETLQGDG
jgi:hypothetical protein